MAKEKEEKVFLENSLSELASKKEVDRFKEIDITEKFVNLQEKHMVALEQERKKVALLETDYKEVERAYEHRVAGLESRLAELSTTLVRYNRNRQEDQSEITKLKQRINELSSMTAANFVAVTESSCQTNPLDIVDEKNEADVTSHVRAIKDKLQYYENLLLNANEYCEKSLKHSISEDYRSVVSTSGNKTSEIKDKDTKENRNEIDNLKVKVRMLSDQNNQLNDHLDETLKKYERQIEDLKEQQMVLCTKYEQEINELHVNYKAQIMDLEVQVQKQRERTLALLEEKEQEVTTLKSSFQIFVPGKHSTNMISTEQSGVISQLEGVLAGTPTHKSQENPHILHYAHELARRDVVINSLRKNCLQLENSLRDLKKELIMIKGNNNEQVGVLKEHIARLERCQTREGANLEYLKNVMVNYLYTKNSNSKRHMLNAIAAVLKLTDVEMSKIKNAL